MLVLPLKRFKRFACRIQFMRGKLQLILADCYLTSQLFRIEKPELNVSLLFYFGVFDISFCLDAFALKRAKSSAYLVNYVLRAFHIVARRSKAALRLVFLMTVLGNSGGVLKNTAPLVAFAGHYIRYSALTDNRVAVTPDAGVEKHLIHIAQANLLAVYKIFALAVTVVAAGDGYFVIRAIYPAVF